MSGKGSGKKRNRAAQGEPHGFQQPPSEKASGGRGVSRAGRGREQRENMGRRRRLERERVEGGQEAQEES